MKILTVICGIMLMFSTAFATTSAPIECNEAVAMADIMFGEGENQPLDAKLDLARFLYSESIKSNISMCEELAIRKPGGALKYSSMHISLDIRKQKNYKKYQETLELAQNSLEDIKKSYQKMSPYDHYITIDLAVKRPPHWFKDYITKYTFSGDHVFVNLDFTHKNPTMYNQMLKDVKNKL